MVGERLRIAVDCDEPLADMNTKLQKWHDRTYRKEWLPIGREGVFVFELWEVWGCSKEEAINRVYKFYESDYFHWITPTKGSIEGVEALAKDNDLFVLTSRQGPTIPYTKPFIDEHYFNKFEKIIFSGNYALNASGGSKADICLEEKADLLIDDCLKHVLDCHEKNIPAILFDCPWNRDIAMQKKGFTKLPGGIVRACGWEEIVPLVKLFKEDKEDFYRVQEYSELLI